MADNEITTTVELTPESNYPSDVQDADAFAIVDDGEHAHIQAIWREDDETVRVGTFYAEAGLCESPTQYGVLEDKFDIDADKPTEDWAHEAANIDPEVSIEIVREHFEN